MIFKITPIAGIATTEILASNDYQAVPLKIDETALVKAGMPITQAGKKAPTGENAIGILLYDVDPTRNPNGAVVVDGIVDWGKCKAHSEATANAADIAKILPKITFREDGKTYAGGGSSGEAAVKSLNDLSDVNISNPKESDTLTYQSGAWKNVAASEAV